MSNPEKNQKPATPDTQSNPASRTELPRGIPVALLRFVRPLQVPGQQSGDSVKAETLANGRRWEIEFIPQMRHHKITFFDAERQKDGPDVGFVHEVHVLSWKPAAL